MNKLKQYLHVSSQKQQLHCYLKDTLWKVYPISTAKNGMGEQVNSYCTPRGWHRVHSRIGLDVMPNSVFVSRLFTGEIYDGNLAKQFPERDWILTRIIQLDGLEPGRNQGGEVDSLQRCIYIHGTPDSTTLGSPGSKGCIRMRNTDIVELCDWIEIDTQVFIE